MFVCMSACAWAYMDACLLSCVRRWVYLDVRILMLVCIWMSVCLTDSNPSKPDLCSCVVEVCARVLAALRHYRVGLKRQILEWIRRFENTIRHNQKLFPELKAQCEPCEECEGLSSKSERK